MNICISRREFSDEYLIAAIGVDTAARVPFQSLRSRKRWVPTGPSQLRRVTQEMQKAKAPRVLRRRGAPARESARLAGTNFFRV